MCIYFIYKNCVLSVQTADTNSSYFLLTVILRQKYFVECIKPKVFNGSLNDVVQYQYT